MGKTVKHDTTSSADLYAEMGNNWSAVFRHLATLPQFRHPDGRPNYFQIGKYTGKRVQQVRNSLIQKLV